MRKWALGLVVGLAVVALPVAWADELTEQSPKAVLRDCYKNLTRTTGYGLQYQMALGTCREDQTEVSNPLRRYQMRGEVFRNIVSVNQGKLLVSNRGGAVYDNEEEKWGKISRTPAGREVETVLRPPVEIVGMALSGAQSMEWAGSAGSSVAAAGGEDIQQTGVVGAGEVIRVVARKSIATKVFGDIKKDADCGGGVCTGG